MKDLRLFYMNGCPYCEKVISYMEDNGINLQMIDIHADPHNKEELIRIGGKLQVPMLLIEDTPLYESEDIIQWLKENI